MSEPKTLYCPKCNNQIGFYDGRSTMNKIMECKVCRKRIIFYPANGVMKVKHIPVRNCSSGVTFY